MLKCPSRSTKYQYVYLHFTKVENIEFVNGKDPTNLNIIHFQILILLTDFFSQRFHGCILIHI